MWYILIFFSVCIAKIDQEVLTPTQIRLHFIIRVFTICTESDLNRHGFLTVFNFRILFESLSKVLFLGLQ